MSAQQFIVDRLNEPPFGMRLTLVAFDEKSPFELLEIVNELMANLSEQHKAAVARKLQAGARRFLGVLRSRALLRAEWRCPPSPSNGQQLVICLWLLRFFDPVHDGVALCTLCRAVVAGMRPALGAPAGVPLRTRPCVNQEWSRTSRP